MGSIRNGARSFLDLMATACRYSRMPGFVSGGRAILGQEDFDTLYALWVPLCSFVDTLIAVDNYYNKIDYTEETVGSEDFSAPE